MDHIVIVAGAAGFIGRHVSKKFFNQGYRVLGIGHDSWGEEDPYSWGLEKWFESEITCKSLEALSEGNQVIAVINCAGNGSVRTSYDDPLKDYHLTVKSTAELLEFTRKKTLQNTRFIQTSSAAVYGDQGNVNLTESAARNPVSPYGFTKVLAENLCDSYSRFFGVKVTVVRLFSVFGEGLRKQLLWDAMNKFSRGEFLFFGTGQELRDWVHVEDAADLLFLAAIRSTENFEIYNGANIQASVLEVLNKLADHSCVNNLPMFNNLEHAGNPGCLIADSQRAKNNLNWKPIISLDAGLARYVQWFNGGMY